MDRCPHCQSPLEWSPQRAHARCTGCAGLYTADGTPVRLEAPGGGFNAEFQAIFEEQLGFTPRLVPNRPPAYWGPSAGTPSAAYAAPPPSPIARMMTIGITLFVFAILGAVGLYVAWVIYAAMPR